MRTRELFPLEWVREGEGDSYITRTPVGVWELMREASDSRRWLLYEDGFRRTPYIISMWDFARGRLEIVAAREIARIILIRWGGLIGRGPQTLREIASKHTYRESGSTLASRVLRGQVHTGDVIPDLEGVDTVYSLCAVKDVELATVATAFTLAPREFCPLLDVLEERGRDTEREEIAQALTVLGI